MKKIGLFGGTFDPIHIGHLLMAEEVYQQLQLDEVWFIPSYIPPHKEKAMTTAEHRVDMLKLAILDNKHFKMEDVELKRKGTSFTIETIKELQKLYQDYQFYFIIGGDMVEYLPKWHKIDELVELVSFIGVKRIGFDFKTEYPVTEVDVPLIEISSTELRQRLAKGENVKYWIQESVRQYIRENGLYGCNRSVE